jgi:hypothetical protein
MVRSILDDGDFTKDGEIDLAEFKAALAPQMLC